MRLALFEPDIPQNAGAIIRLGACLGVAIDVIEPCGFLFDDRRLRRAGLDYLDLAEVVRHRSWPAFLAARAATRGRLVLVTTGGETVYAEFAFRADDVILVGRESDGAPAHVHATADARLRIPMVAGRRSLNVAQAAAIALAEALRQTGGLPREERPR
ncbi:MAG: tRNA methyltransferase [Proteobacteria bacterium]|nr:tRNA methyltransferase [Pseudomonadota bacterium]